ncbi:MAG: elongation factor G [Planctomycetota bacterium]|nr:MAG: elongation factor G [Planctomycetota bacterium]
MSLVPENIRNIALVGHGGSGKTSLAEALLFKTGMTNRLGKVPEKTSILDYSDEEKEKLSSLDSAVCFLTHGDLHVNLVDTPGTPAFCGPAIAALAAAECAVVVVSASSGVQVNTRKMYERARDYGLGVWFVINHIDASNVDLPAVVAQIRETFGPQCLPLNLPAGGGTKVVDCFTNESGESDFGEVEQAHTDLIEAIVGTDEELMEKYLGGEFSTDEARAAAARAVATGELMPILFTDSLGDVGIDAFLEALAAFCPSPVTGKHRILHKEEGDEGEPVAPSVDGPFLAQVFKITTDPRSNIKYLSIRVHRGKLTSDMALKAAGMTKGARPGQIMRSLGAEHREIDAGIAGDVICLAKLDFNIGDTLYTTEGGTLEMPKFPEPMFSLALESKSRGDEDKIGVALKRFSEEDPCFKFDRGTGGELVVHGMGEMQLRTYLSRMSRQYKLDVETKPPKIPYRETILGTAQNVEYTHKKQTGGAGQFARVVINLLPAERGEGYEFIDKIFGGAIDQAFRPSVDKGIRAQMAEGVLAGYPVVDVKVELIDGKTHPVDSKDIAFQIAGRGAFKDAFLKAKPVLLEPIVNLEVTVPADNVGDIQGDLASRRGRPQGQDMLPGNMALIRALVPLAELADYSSRLSSITGGEGSYSMEFSHYEVVPGNIQQQIIDAAKKEKEAAAAS